MTRDILPPPAPTAALLVSSSHSTGAAGRTSLAGRAARVSLLMALAATVAACGGGGDSSSPAPAPAPTPAPPPPSGSVAISGTATYEFVPAAADHTGLDYSVMADKPIRGATVQLLDGTGSTVIASTVTGTDGRYSFTLASSQAVIVRVRAELKQTASASVGGRDIQVVDNTSSGALYTLDSAAFTPTAATTQNLRAASGWTGGNAGSYTGTRASGPFSVLDTAYAAQAKIAAVSPTTTLPPIKMNWSVNNVPGGNAPATGQIGTSYFTVEGGNAKLYLLGKDGTDTDEFDQHVVAHEFGHYLQYAISRDDSVGGTHTSDDKLDRRVAFSEGWGNGWSGIVFDDPYYTDSYGPRQQNGFFLNVSTPAADADRGAYSETTGQYLVWSTYSALGFAPVYGALTRMATSPTFTTLYNFADKLKAAGADATTVTNLWATQDIVAADAYGTGETNNGGNPAYLPVYKDYGSTPGVTQNYCVTTANGADGNKLGEYVYIRFTISGARTITVTRTSSTYSSPAAADPDLSFVFSTGAKASSESSTANVETANLTLPSGTHVAALMDYNLMNQSSSSAQSCFNFVVN